MAAPSGNPASSSPIPAAIAMHLSKPTGDLPPGAAFGRILEDCIKGRASRLPRPRKEKSAVEESGGEALFGEHRRHQKSTGESR